MAAPLRLRVLHREDGLVTITPKQGLAQAAHSRAVIAETWPTTSSGSCRRGRGWSAATATAPPPATRRSGRGTWPVLVRTNRQANLVRGALAAVGITAVINGAGSVFATPVAREWLRLLEALERPTSMSRARSVALTAFLGWTAEQVAAADDDVWEAVHFTLNRWAGVLRRHGVASLLELVSSSEGLPARLLTRAGGERDLTDLRHVGQLLHTAATAEGLGTTALTAWLRQRIAEAEEDTNSEERSRRLESDAEAVQVLTIHRSKGLEFPVVYLPYLWEPGYIPSAAGGVPRRPQRRRPHDRRELTGDERDGWADHRSAYVREQRGEDLRLAYVALTRAKHQAVLWWAAGKDSENSALFRLLFARAPTAACGPTTTGCPTNQGGRDGRDTRRRRSGHGVGGTGDGPGRGAVDTAGPGGGRSLRRPVRTATRPVVAAHVVHRDRRRRPRGPRRQRAGSRRHHRRTGGGGNPSAGDPAPTTTTVRRPPTEAAAARGAVAVAGTRWWRRCRHLRPPHPGEASISPLPI